MGGLKTYLATLGLGLVLTGPAGAVEDVLTVFARCSGQMSAEREHAWLMQRDAGAFEAARARFLSLVEAVGTEQARRAALHDRIEAKHLHAALLREADFGTDRLRARAAQRRAASRIRLCRSLL
ncbi:hypothetical protein AB9K41_02205, partial [Cribrihabitans sp. XS_ASV171]